MRVIIGTALLLTLSACTDEAGARRAIEASGMTPVEVGGYPMWGCDQNDTFATKFKARNAQGREVSGVVCSTWWKGATVRTF